MKDKFSSPRGQALVELAMVIPLFLLVLMGLLQAYDLGQAHIQCQLAARRAAWIYGTSHHAQLNAYDGQIQALGPGVEIVSAQGSRQNGYCVKVKKNVRSIGFFRWLRPEGFTVHAQSAVIAYNEAPDPWGNLWNYF